MRHLLLALALLLAAPAWSQQAFDLPGLTEDAGRLAVQLRQRQPAGGTPQQRAQAEQRANQAERQGNWAAAAQAWEDRIAAGEVRREQWLSLARALLNRNPPDPARAMAAAWNNFLAVPGGRPEVPSLLLIGQALARSERLAEALAAFEAALALAPNDTDLQRTLAEARRAAGMLVRRVNTEPDAEPARACIAFTNPPARRNDWQPQDWVRAEPALPGMAVTREGDALCVAGLPFGRGTRLVLRAGLPGEEQVNLRADTPVAITMPDRTPRIAFDTRAFLLPRGQPLAVTVATVNISALQLRLIRVTERGLVPLSLNNWRPGQAMDEWLADDLGENIGRVVWEGRAELPRGAANVVARHALPIPDLLRNAGPGLFVLAVRAGDGRNARDTAALLPVFVTDLGLTAWRGADGLAVQVRGFADARAKPGTRVMLLSRNNDLLSEATTDAEGLVRFGAALLRGRSGLAPVAIHAEAGDDLAALSLDAAAFDLSDRGATGLPHPGALDAFIWLDRGIYRPGETVQVAALLRDAGGAPADLPVRLRVKRPNGQTLAEFVPPRQEGGAVFWPLALSPGASFGQYSIEALADPNAPPIGTTSFRVDAFLPERLEVTAGPAPGPLVPGIPLNVPVTARFLYGAPGSGLSGTAELRLVVNPEPFEAWRGWRFGLAEESFAPDLVSFDIPETDAQGRTTLALALPQAPDTTQPLRANVVLSIGEPGGRESRSSLDIPVRARGNFVAIKPGFSDDAVNPGTEAAFELAAVSPDGASVPTTLRVRLVRERPQWRLVVRERLARYETVWVDEPVDTAELRVAPNAPGRFARNLAFGRYRLEATDGGLGIASIRFRSGWAGVEAAEVPDKVDVAADQRAYAPGAMARLRITPPFAGRASVAVLTDRLLSLREVEVAAGGTEITLPVEASWGPGAYVAVTVFRPGEARNGQPGRALGLAWLGLDPAARLLNVAIEAAPLVRPRQRIEVPVRIAGASGAMLTLAAVDEGILRLTRFASPDPAAHFLGRRRLGVDIRDDYGRLIAPTEGDAATLRQGGDGSDGSLVIQPPQRLIALFSGPVSVGADGLARVPLELPDFAGEVRLMVVAWTGNRIGHASRAMTVRDTVVAEALLPRFLAPGDEVRLPLLLHNLDLPEGEVAVTLTTEGPLALAGPARLAATLATGARAQPFTTLRATGAGEGVLRLSVTGPQNFAVTREARITLRASRPRSTEIASSELPPGRDAALAPPLDRFLPGTWQARAVWGGAVRYDVAALLRAVEEFPLDCLEQAASRALSLASVSDLLAGPDRVARLQRAVVSMLDRQRFDGAFGVWSAQGAPEAWLTPYAVEVLVRARAAGAEVPEAALNAALTYLEAELEEAALNTPEALAAQAYRVHALGLAGRNRMGAARRLFEGVDQLPTPLAKAQLGAAFARAGDRERAETAFLAALAQTGRRIWWRDYGSPARDSLAIAVLLRESGLLPERLSTLLARLPGADLRPANSSTQEQAWALAAAAALGRDGRAVRISVDGNALPPAPLVSLPLTGSATARNLADAAVFQSVSVTGVPVQPLPAGREGLRITRRFLTLDGQNVNLDQLRQGTAFLLLLEARAETNETHRAMLQQGLPAGWEIAARLPAGAVQGMPFLGELSEAAAFPALDDRFAAAADLTPQAPLLRFAVRLRAVSAGSFELPGAEVQDMYRPGIFARQASGRITVLPE